jgi:hypothetical protein
MSGPETLLRNIGYMLSAGRRTNVSNANFYNQEAVDNDVIRSPPLCRGDSSGQAPPHQSNKIKINSNAVKRFFLFFRGGGGGRG